MPSWNNQSSLPSLLGQSRLTVSAGAPEATPIAIGQAQDHPLFGETKRNRPGRAGFATQCEQSGALRRRFFGQTVFADRPSGRRDDDRFARQHGSEPVDGLLDHGSALLHDPHTVQGGSVLLASPSIGLLLVGERARERVGRGLCLCYRCNQEQRKRSKGDHCAITSLPFSDRQACSYARDVISDR